jgi:hypothetical protein
MLLRPDGRRREENQKMYQQKLFYKKIEKKKAAPRRDPGVAPERLTRTKFPFAALVNGERVTVWPDWIERKDWSGDLLLAIWRVGEDYDNERFGQGVG